MRDVSIKGESCVVQTAHDNFGGCFMAKIFLFGDERSPEITISMLRPCCTWIEKKILERWVHCGIRIAILAIDLCSELLYASTGTEDCQQSLKSKGGHP